LQRRGSWRLASTVPIFVIVCNELPTTPQTLIFRLMGTGDTLLAALRELAAASPS